jgi:ubiquinone/menaquinone biosynthesis C-methylase UbiE
MGVVSEFSQWLIGRSGYADDGFAAAYDRYRPRPPAAVLDVLTRCAGGGRPGLVVDLGCGTGLSTRAWAGRALGVVGVEANPAMAEQARAATAAAEVEYVVGYAHDTGLDDGVADIVTCAQSFHWMDPAVVLPEAARILRPGGVFAAYDYDVVPVIEPHVDAAFAANVAARGAARERMGLEAGASTWPKHQHLQRLRESGLFAHTREVQCHAETEADADHLVGMAYSIGGPVEIFGDEAPEVGASLDILRSTAERVLGDHTQPMLIGYTIRLGITAE